jgi:hypothetical protein
MGKQHLIETSQWIQWIESGSIPLWSPQKMNPASIFGPKYWQWWVVDCTRQCHAVHEKKKNTRATQTHENSMQKEESAAS